MARMRILKKMRRQIAVHWPVIGVTREGKKTYGDPEELVVRWEDCNDQFLDQNGSLQTSKAKVYTGVDLKLMSVLWLSSQMLGSSPGSALEELTDPVNPLKNPNAYAVRKFDKLPTLKVKTEEDFLRTAYL